MTSVNKKNLKLVKQLKDSLEGLKVQYQYEGQLHEMEIRDGGTEGTGIRAHNKYYVTYPCIKASLFHFMYPAYQYH